MTEKVCQLYEEEQVGKIREGRKAVPSSKMPDLGWDIAETQLQEGNKVEEAQKLPETVKKIPMTEKVCQLYEEEQVGKTREGKKAVPTSKMPDLGWDIAEVQLQEIQEKPEDNITHTAPWLQLLITIAIIITAFLEHIAMYVKEIPRITNKTV